MDQRPWLAQVLDESHHLTPVASLLIVGAVSFTLVLGVLVITQKTPTLSRLFVPDSAEQGNMYSKEEILRALSAHNVNTLTVDQKLDILQNLRDATVVEASPPTYEKKLEILKNLSSL